MKVEDSPFKEKIKIQSDSEPNSAVKPGNNSYLQTAASTNQKASFEEQPSSSRSGGGGCPMMQVDDNKRNPGLFIPEVTFHVPYISSFSEYINPDMKNPSENFESYPTHLKDSLCLFGEDYDKYRKLEVGYKFFVSDELKENGNKHFRDGNYQKAMLEYTKAFSIIRWLELDESKHKNVLDQLEELRKFNGSENEGESGEQGLKEEKNPPRRVAPADDSDDEVDAKKKNAKLSDEKIHEMFADKMTRLLFSPLNDENVKLVDGFNLKEKPDIEMHENLVFSLNLNLIACYIKLNDHVESRKVVRDSEKINSNSSILLFRKAQAIYANAESSVHDLEKAKKALIVALATKKTEKIYEHHAKFLNMFGLENHATAFDELLAAVEKRITSMKEKCFETAKIVLSRVAEIQRAEKDIIARGLTPHDGPERTFAMFSKDKNIEMKIYQGMIGLYRKALSFYNNDENKDKFQHTREGYAQVKRIFYDFNKFWLLDFNDKAEWF